MQQKHLDKRREIIADLKKYYDLKKDYVCWVSVSASKESPHWIYEDCILIFDEKRQPVPSNTGMYLFSLYEYDCSEMQKNMIYVITKEDLNET